MRRKKNANIGAIRIRVLVVSGPDPRELERHQNTNRDARNVQDYIEAVTVQQAWNVYLAASKARWGARHYAEHVAKGKAG